MCRPITTLLPHPCVCAPRRIAIFVLVGLFVLSMVLSAGIMKLRNVAAITFTVLTQCVTLLGALLIVAAFLMKFTSAMGALTNLQVCVSVCV